MPCPPERDAQLARAGWRRQFTAAEPRLSEAVEQYRALGFQVLLEPVDPAACRRDGQCSACFDDPAAAAALKTIYTRKATDQSSSD